MTLSISGWVRLASRISTTSGLRYSNLLFNMKASFCTLPSHTLVCMPKLSPTMSSGVIGSWKKKEGDTVAPGDIIAEVETDKATVEFEAQDDFIIAKILVEAGAPEVAVGAPIAVSVEEEADVAAFKNFSIDAESTPPKSEPESTTAAPPEPPASTAKQAPPSPQKPPSSTPVSQPTETRSTEFYAQLAQPIAGMSSVLASPLAKLLAREQGKSLESVDGSYPGGFLVAADVSKASGGAGAGVAAQSLASYAEQVTFSKRNVPHYYLSAECEVDQAEALLANDGNISLDDVVLKAAACASMKVPAVNSIWLGDRIRQFERVDVNLLVQGSDGKIAQPLLLNLASRGVSSIASARKAVLEKVEEGTLAGDEELCGTITVAFVPGADEFSGVIRVPQSSILSVGSVRTVAKPKKSAVIKNGTISTEDIRAAKVISVTLSCDHRVVDGAVGAQWLSTFKSHLEDPMSMIR